MVFFNVGGKINLERDLIFCLRMKRESNYLTFFNITLPIKFPNTKLGSLHISHDGNGPVIFLGKLSDEFNLFIFFLMSSMRKIKPSYIHSCLNELCQNFFAPRSRADSTNNFCSF